MEKFLPGIFEYSEFIFDFVEEFEMLFLASQLVCAFYLAFMKSFPVSNVVLFFLIIVSFMGKKCNDLKNIM